MDADTAPFVLDEADVIPNKRPIQVLTHPIRPAATTESSATRARCGIAVPASATISRSPLTADTGKRSIRLTVKAQPSKLREVTTGSTLSSPVQQRDGLSRSSKNKKPIIDASSDEDEDDAENDDDEEADQGEDNEVEDEEEETLEIVPPRQSSFSRQPPRVKVSAPPPTDIPVARKPSPARILKLHSNLKSVEDKEMEETTPAVSDDDDLSSVNSPDEDEEDPENGAASDDEDNEQSIDYSEDDDLDRMLLDEANDTLPGDATKDNMDISGSDLGSDDENDSASGTPDVTKLTRRQRAAHFGDDPASPSSGLASYEGGLMALSNDPQKKKFFTAEQLTMRRAEMARRRKDLSEKRMEEEKADTLQRLLHKPSAPKRKGRAQIGADAEKEEWVEGLGEGGEGVIRVRKANPLFVRTVINAQGTRVGVPEEWLGAPVGRVFNGAMKGPGGLPSMNGRLVMEVDE